MKIFICFLLFIGKLYALPLRELNPVTLRLGQWKFIENTGHYQKLRNIKKVCHESILQNDKITFTDCPHIIEVLKKNNTTQFKIKLKNSSSQTNLTFHFKKEPKEHFFGAGTQYSHLRLNDQNIEFLSQEQGNGRGKQPLTFFQDLIQKGLSGHSTTTYASSPIIISHKLYSIILDTSFYATADFSKENRFDVTIYSKKASFKFFRANSWSKLFKETTRITGRMRPLPKWIQQGAILGLMGGESSVKEKIKRIENFGTKIVGIWHQDWVGTRDTFLGTRLKWDWQKDHQLYNSLDFKYPSLGYFNPYLTSIPKTKNRIPQFLEAKEKNFLLKVNGEYIKSNQGGFEAYLVDLYNPEAFLWLKEKMKMVITKYNFKGWMADFSENAPMTNLGKKHHQYIELWIKLNHEIVEELDPENLTFFNRASHLKVPGFSTLYWLGDQTSTWDRYDGLHSSLIGLLTSGLSGKVFNHSDIGGYVSLNIPFFNIKRESELLQRWMELNAFTNIFRTHPGLNPKLATQVYSNEKTLKSFSKWTNIFSELYEYKKSYINLASDFGFPIVRPLFLNYPHDSKTYTIDDQFFLGDQLLIAPVLKKDLKKRRVYLPKGYWTHLWTNRVYISKGKYVEVNCPLGQPPVFHTPEFSSKLAKKLRSF